VFRHAPVGTDSRDEDLLIAPSRARITADKLREPEDTRAPPVDMSDSTIAIHDSAIKFVRRAEEMTIDG